MKAGLDPEIDGIFDGDPELIQLAHLVRSARPEPALDPRFEAVLRAQLMREAALRAPAAEKQQRGARQHTAHRAWWRRPMPFAFTGAGLGVALAAAAVITIISRPIQDHQVVTGPEGTENPRVPSVLDLLP